MANHGEFVLPLRRHSGLEPESRFVSLIKMLKNRLDKRTGFRVKPGITPNQWVSGRTNLPWMANHSASVDKVVWLTFQKTCPAMYASTQASRPFALESWLGGRY